MQKEAKILWTTDNKETSLNMVCLYAHNAKLLGWIDDVTILVWGASQQLINNDKEIQDKVKQMAKDGVKIVACQKCSENLGNGVKENLESCNIDVFYTGEFLTNWIQSGDNIITV